MTAIGSRYHVDSTRGALYEVVSIDDGPGPNPYRYTFRLVGQPAFGQALGDEIRANGDCVDCVRAGSVIDRHRRKDV